MKYLIIGAGGTGGAIGAYMVKAGKSENALLVLSGKSVCWQMLWESISAKIL